MNLSAAPLRAPAKGVTSSLGSIKSVRDDFQRAALHFYPHHGDRGGRDDNMDSVDGEDSALSGDGKHQGTSDQIHGWPL